jgi:hypothetical protein
VLAGCSRVSVRRAQNHVGQRSSLPHPSIEASSESRLRYPITVNRSANGRIRPTTAGKLWRTTSRSHLVQMSNIKTRPAASPIIQSGFHTDSIFGQVRNTTVQVWTIGEGIGIGSEFSQTCCAANNFRDHDLTSPLNSLPLSNPTHAVWIGLDILMI